MDHDDGWSDPSIGILEIRKSDYGEKVCDRCKQIYSAFSPHGLEDCIESLEERLRMLWEHVTGKKA